MIKADHPSRTADELDRAPLAARIRDVITKLRPDDQGFTISIEGRWGEGKSWIIDKLKVELGVSAHVVEFNPWLVGNRASLLTEFFSCLSSQLKEATATKLKKLMSSYAKRLSKAAQGAGNEYVAVVGSIAVAALREKSELESLADLRFQLADQLKLLPRKIVVVIDDIDRLAPAEVVEVIRLIKAVGELPNVIYVVAVDPEYVESALRNAGHGQYDNYLDKIIQLRVAVPPLRYPQKWKLLRQQLDCYWESAMISAAPGGKDACEYRLGQLASSIAKVIENPRDIKRIWNRFIFVEPACRGEVNPIDLLALQAVYIKIPNVYNEICRFPERFTHGEALESSSPKARLNKTLKRNESSNDNSDEIESEFLTELLEAKTPTARTAISKLIYDLFPFMEWGEFKQNSRKENGHLDNLRVLNVALNAGGLEEQWTQNEINALLNEPSKRIEILKRNFSYELAIDLYGQLDDLNINTVPSANLDSLVVDLAKVNEILNNDDIDGHFAKVIQTWSSRKFRGQRTSQKESPDWLYAQISVLLDSSRLNIAYKLLRVEYSEQSNSHIESSENGALTVLRQKFSATLIDKLDKDDLKHEPKAASMLWSLMGIDDIAFNSLADSFARFEKWFDIEAYSPGCVTSSNSGRFEFHKVNADRLVGWGGIQKIEPYLIKIESRENQGSSQYALANAYRQPGIEFDAATGEKLARF